MRPRSFVSVGLAAILGGAVLSGCVHHYHDRHTPPQGAVVVHKKGGPPPWAPAHGYRHKHESGVDLVFDSGLGVYVVIEHPGYYFHKDRFYHHVDGRWLVGVSLGGTWVIAGTHDVPSKLRGKYAGKKHRGKGKVPAKHRD